MAMELLAWVAAALVFACFFMKTIVPLRLLAIASNVAFIWYAALGIYEGIFSKVLPIFVLHLALLPLNVIRVAEVRRVISSISTWCSRKTPHAMQQPIAIPTASCFALPAIKCASFSTRTGVSRSRLPVCWPVTRMRTWITPATGQFQRARFRCVLKVDAGSSSGRSSC